MSSSQKTLSFLSWQLLSELDEIKHDQYSWLMKAREELLDNWKTYRVRYRSWRGKVDNIVDGLAQKGDTEGASWLTHTLLRDPIISNPTEFELTIPTGNGTEIIHIRGCPDQPPAAMAEEPPAVPAPDIAEVQSSLPSPASDPEPKSPSPAPTKLGRTRSSVAQPSATTDAGPVVPPPEKCPTKTITKARTPPRHMPTRRMPTRSQPSRGRPKKIVKSPLPKKAVQRSPPNKTVRSPSPKEIAQPASTGRTTRSTEQNSKSAVAEKIDLASKYLCWRLVQLQEEVRARKMKAGNMRKADLVELLVQDDNDLDKNTEDTSQPSTDAEASTAKATDDETSEPTGEAASTTGDGAVDAGDGGREELPGPREVVNPRLGPDGRSQEESQEVSFANVESEVVSFNTSLRDEPPRNEEQVSVAPCA